MYPDDSLQSVIHPDPWWIKNESGQICRGALVRAYIPHVDQIPYAFEPVGREEPTEHESARVRVAPLKVNQPLKRVELPVAAMPSHPNEVWGAYRTKRRPCLVFGCEKAVVDKSLTRGKPNHSTAPTFLVAPFYGADHKETRAGYSQEFIERVRHCEYPQFHWDQLPIKGADESILRLDHLQPIGAHHDGYMATEYMLSSDAMNLLDDLLHWLVWGGVPGESILLDYRKLIESTFG